MTHPKDIEEGHSEHHSDDHNKHDNEGGPGEDDFKLYLSSKRRNQHYLLALCIVVVGVLCATAFLTVGIRGLRNDQSLRLQKKTTEIVKAVQTTWNEYETVALWIHQNFRTKDDFSTFSEERHNFEILYEYTKSIGLEIESLAYVPNITHRFRAGLEQEAAEYYRE